MRKFLWVVAVGALVLALAAPAMALDVSWAGRFRIRMFQTNIPIQFGNAAAAAVGGTDVNTRAAGVASNITDDQPNSSYVQQRFRVFTTFKANDDVKFVWGLEMGYIQWGLNTANEGSTAGGSKVGRGSGGGFDADGVNLETKLAYLELTVPYFTTWKARAGLQGYTSNPPGWILDNDLPGIRLWGPLPFIDRAEFQYFLISSSPSGLSKNEGRGSSVNEHWFGLELDKKITKDLGVGLSAYWKKDDTGVAVQATTSGITNNKFWIVPRATLKIANVDLEGMFLYGNENNAARPQRPGGSADVIDRSGYGVDVTAKTQIGPWSPSIAFVWAQGDRNGNKTGARSGATKLHSFPGLDGRRFTGAGLSTTRSNDVFGFRYYSDILFGNIGDDTGLLDDQNNFDLGLFFLHLEAKYAVTKAFSVMPYYNYARSGVKNNLGDGGAGSSDIGHEIGAVFTHKLWGNATLDVVPAYFLTGDFFKTANVRDPADIWKVTTRLQYVF